MVSGVLVAAAGHVLKADLNIDTPKLASEGVWMHARHHGAIQNRQPCWRVRPPSASKALASAILNVTQAGGFSVAKRDHSEGLIIEKNCPDSSLYGRVQ
eukprot:2547673-Amphidinium_carterae.2